ncbi:hypothetical protein [Priestia megaterium]|uniref:hypothetical protein n=1 Tax=Priestia megaterium TaxID=1404 RepID=UPI001FB2F836|nr:hypothetical protein [Priestia megaterium]
MDIDPSSSFVRELREAAVTYFEETYKNIQVPNGEDKKGEVSIIDAMHRNIKDLGEKWNQVFDDHNKGLKVQVIPVFIHTRPVVDFGRDKGTEFGDLLYVYSELNSQQNKKEKKALLLQAKVNSNDNIDEDQLYLYQNWPKFSFRDKKIGEEILPLISSRSINEFQVSCPNTGANYLFIENRESESPSPFEKRYETANPLNLYKSRSLFVDNLLELMDFKSETGREIIDLKVCDWSRSIEAVLKWAEQKQYTYRRSGWERVGDAILSYCLRNNNKHLNSNAYIPQLLDLYKKISLNFSHNINPPEKSIQDGPTKKFIIVHIIVYPANYRVDSIS